MCVLYVVFCAMFYFLGGYFHDIVVCFIYFIQSIGIAAAPKFKEPAVSSSSNFVQLSQPVVTSKSNTSAGATRASGGSTTTITSGSGFGSRVSAVGSTAYDAAADLPNSTWDEDKELDDLIGDD